VADAFARAAVTARPEALARASLVGAAFGADHAVLAELVGHGIGERLDRVRAGDGVPVEVEEGVELVEAQAAVAVEEGQAGGAEGAAAQRDGVALLGRGRRLVVFGWSAATAPLGAGPEAVAEGTELVEDLEPAGRQGFELGVDSTQLVQEAVALDLELEARRSVEARRVAHGELAAWAQVRWGFAAARHRVVLVSGR
jgi:hypothetical protein